MKISLFLASLWLAFASFFVPAEKTFLLGKVSDQSGEPLIGATVKILKNRELVKNTLSDAEGKYRLEIEPGTYDVEFSYTGFAARRIVGVQVLANQTNTLDVRLDASAALEEVVVTDYRAARGGMGGPATGGAAPAGADASVSDERHAISKERAAHLKKSDVAASAKMAAPKEKAPTEKKPAATEVAPKDKIGEKLNLATAPPPSADYEVVEIDGEMKKARIVFEPETYEEKIEIVDDESVETSRKEKIETSEDKSVVPPPGKPTQPKPRAGLLTAGEWNDLHNWNRHWADLLADGEIEQHQTLYGFFPKHRYTVLLANEQDFPLADAFVTLKGSGGETIWEAKTDNTGKAELWAHLFNPTPSPSTKGEGSAFRVEVWVNGKKHEIAQPKLAKDGINFLKINAECNSPKNVDIVWAVDATGSMGDEIEYLKTELLDVIGRAKNQNPELAFRMGTVFYRDKSDAYITKSSGLSPDISKTVDFIKKQSADGGGDYPEAVHSALEEAIFGQKWSKDAIARICFLVLDASPHRSPEVNASLQKSIREAARLGIRIVPVTASGIQKDTEFLMKFFGLATNGTYVFLTDHSGIGGKHLEPTTDEYKVEPLNQLLVRLITEYTTTETCEGKSQILFVDNQGQNGNSQNPDWKALYYPNPASTQFMLELPFDVQSATIYDSEGKAVRKLEKPSGGRHTVVVADLSEGFYTIRILKDGAMQSGKLVVVRA
jgi:hypothetical protein